MVTSRSQVKTLLSRAKKSSLRAFLLACFLSLSLIDSKNVETNSLCQMFDEEYVTCPSPATHREASEICHEWGGSLTSFQTGDIFLDDAIRDMGTFQVGSVPWWAGSDTGCLLSDGSRPGCQSEHPFICTLEIFLDHPAVCFQDP